jgi:hypothetical protein
MQEDLVGYIPSGNLTAFSIENGPFIVNLPITNGDFRYVSFPESR